MELYCAVGGQTDSLKRWEADLNAQFFPVYKNGKPFLDNGIPQYRRLLVAPVQLYKIAFAKEELQTVLSMVQPSDYIQKRYSVLNKGLRWIKKILGLKPVPRALRINPFLQPNQVDKAVFVIPIGLKDDAITPDGQEMI